MKFPPKYTQTEKITSLLHDLEVLKEAYGLHPLPEQTILHLRRISLLKSSLYSARIEGNPLTWDDIRSTNLNNSQEQHKKEIANITKAYEYLYKTTLSQITPELLIKLHALVLGGIGPDIAKFRNEDSAIFNQAGIAIYLPPAPQQIHTLIDALCSYCNTSKDPLLVIAALGHIWFEKIHPFLDGNGRVGRLLTALLLKKSNYDFGSIVPFEEYLDANRDLYYDALAIDRQDVTPFIEFFLTALLTQAKKSLKESANPPTIPFPNLLPRRAEIVEIIKDHSLVSFDFLSRRFRSVPTRTLHYDLTQLIKQGYIKKLGSTRGAIYALKDSKGF